MSNLYYSDIQYLDSPETIPAIEYTAIYKYEELVEKDNHKLDGGRYLNSYSTTVDDFNACKARLGTPTHYIDYYPNYSGHNSYYYMSDDSVQYQKSTKKCEIRNLYASGKAIFTADPDYYSMSVVRTEHELVGVPRAKIIIAAAKEGLEYFINSVGGHHNNTFLQYNANLANGQARDPTSSPLTTIISYQSGNSMARNTTNMYLSRCQSLIDSIPQADKDQLLDDMAAYQAKYNEAVVVMNELKTKNKKLGEHIPQQIALVGKYNETINLINEIERYTSNVLNTFFARTDPSNVASNEEMKVVVGQYLAYFNRFTHIREYYYANDTETIFIDSGLHGQYNTEYLKLDALLAKFWKDALAYADIRASIAAVEALRVENTNIANNAYTDATSCLSKFYSYLVDRNGKISTWYNNELRDGHIRAVVDYDAFIVEQNKNKVTEVELTQSLTDCQNLLTNITPDQKNLVSSANLSAYQSVYDECTTYITKIMGNWNNVTSLSATFLTQLLKYISLGKDTTVPADNLLSVLNNLSFSEINNDIDIYVKKYESLVAKFSQSKTFYDSIKSLLNPNRSLVTEFGTGITETQSILDSISAKFAAVHTENARVASAEADRIASLKSQAVKIVDSALACITSYESSLSKIGSELSNTSVNLKNGALRNVTVLKSVTQSHNSLPSANKSTLIPLEKCQTGMLVLTAEQKSYMVNEIAEFDAKYSVAVTSAGVIDSKWVDVNTQIMTQNNAVSKNSDLENLDTNIADIRHMLDTAIASGNVAQINLVRDNIKAARTNFVDLKGYGDVATPIDIDYHTQYLSLLNDVSNDINSIDSILETYEQNQRNEAARLAALAQEIINGNKIIEDSLACMENFNVNTYKKTFDALNIHHNNLKNGMVRIDSKIEDIIHYLNTIHIDDMSAIVSKCYANINIMTEHQKSSIDMTAVAKYYADSLAKVNNIKNKSNELQNNLLAQSKLIDETSEIKEVILDSNNLLKDVSVGLANVDILTVNMDIVHNYMKLLADLRAELTEFTSFNNGITMSVDTTFRNDFSGHIGTLTNEINKIADILDDFTARREKSLSDEQKRLEAAKKREIELAAESKRKALALEKARLENERLAKLKADEAEKARLENERLAKLKADEEEKARLAQLAQDAEDRKNKMIIGGIIVLALLITCIIGYIIYKKSKKSENPTIKNVKT